MWHLRIGDHSPEGFLAFDLRDVLRALGDDALKWTWIVSCAGGENIAATGIGATELEALERSGARISGSHLLDIAERTHQIIWGEFQAFPDTRPVDPWLRITALDSSWYDVLCKERDLLAKVASAFRDTTLAFR